MQYRDASLAHWKVDADEFWIGDTEDPDFICLKSGMDLECGANLSSEAFCRMIGAVDDVDDFGESCARICRPAAGRAVFITHTNECIKGRGK